MYIGLTGERIKGKDLAVTGVATHYVNQEKFEKINPDGVFDFHKLKEKVRTMGNYEAVRYLLGFTRQAFRYKTDSEAYGLENVTFSPEETLFYPDSDCEDRSILFVFLVREVLMLDAILIDYPEHASAAVNFKTTSYGEPILYNGSKYTICEPTGPGNDLLPGQYPNGLENVPFNIIDK